MIEDILEKRELLNSRKPFPRDVAERFEKLNFFDFLYNDLKLDGSNLTEEGVARMIEGDIVAGVSLREHNEINRHQAALKRFHEMRHMDMTIDRQQLEGLYRAISEDPTREFRRKSPILYHLDFTPSHCTEIPDKLDQLFRSCYRNSRGGDFIRVAADLHNGIIAVYPYDEGSEMLARSVFQYEMIRAGLFPIKFGVSEQDYHMQITQAVKENFKEPFYRTVCRAVDRKLDLAISLI